MTYQIRFFFQSYNCFSKILFMTQFCDHISWEIFSLTFSKRVLNSSKKIIKKDKFLKYSSRKFFVNSFIKVLNLCLFSKIDVFDNKCSLNNSCTSTWNRKTMKKKIRRKYLKKWDLNIEQYCKSRINRDLLITTRIVWYSSKI